MEFYRQITDFPDYYINIYGTVYNSKTDYILEQTDNGNGYLDVRLTRGGKSKHKYVHRLLAEAFIEKLDGCGVVNHRNRTRTDNRLSNLEWTTDRRNQQNRTDQSSLGHNISFLKN